MASIDDVVSNLKNVVTNIGQFVTQFTSPGMSLSTTPSPKATTVTSIGTTSVQVIAANASRRHIEFYNPIAASSTVYLMPNATAVINQGIPIVAVSSYVPQTWLNVTGAWNAISSVAGATSVLTVIEFF